MQQLPWILTGLGCAGLAVMAAIVANWLRWNLACGFAALIALGNLGVVAGHIVAMAERMGA
ncbi:MAG: hypothetical protein U1C74_21650 [Phenylobacterium sp.]|nr:hypothetical protein [Phenylobacterium sp.]